MTCERGCCPSPAEHYRSLSFYSVGEGTVHKREKQLAKDRDAYKRLRENGTQPARLDGCARIEQVASTKEEVEHGHSLRTH
jgi:hypothetical protein